MADTQNAENRTVEARVHRVEPFSAEWMWAMFREKGGTFEYIANVVSEEIAEQIRARRALIFQADEETRLRETALNDLANLRVKMIGCIEERDQLRQANARMKRMIAAFSRELDAMAHDAETIVRERQHCQFCDVAALGIDACKRCDGRSNFKYLRVPMDRPRRRRCGER